VWREKVIALNPAVGFFEPARSEQLDEVERALSIALPGDLISMLSETNGVTDSYGAGLIWSTDRLISDNLLFRESESFHELYMPFDALLFFADAGNGDQFAFPLTSTGVRGDVFVWDHEDDSRRWYAGSLEQYLSSWRGDHSL
jgi:hypothetical protein